MPLLQTWIPAPWTFSTRRGRGLIITPETSAITKIELSCGSGFPRNSQGPHVIIANPKYCRSTRPIGHFLGPELALACLDLDLGPRPIPGNGPRFVAPQSPSSGEMARQIIAIRRCSLAPAKRHSRQGLQERRQRERELSSDLYIYIFTY